MIKIKENKFVKKFLNKEIIMYLIFGVLTTVVSLVTKYALLFTILDASKPLDPQIAVIVSWITACLFAYITNRIWVFETKSKNIFFEMVKFFSARLVTLGMEMLIMYIFVTALKLNSDAWVVIITIITQFLIVIANYILSKIFVFKNNKKDMK